MFFSKFKKIDYMGKQAVNITQSVILKYKTMYNTTLWQFHTVVEGETPETIANKYYGEASDHWVILLVNNIVDPYFDWALSNRELVAMVKSSYGEDAVDRVHHLIDLTTKKWVDQATARQYVTEDGVVFKALPANFSPVTNLEYENMLNDEKRDIKILSPRYLQDFKNQFEDAMRGEGV